MPQMSAIPSTGAAVQRPYQDIRLVVCHPLVVRKKPRARIGRQDRTGAASTKVRS
jgi:hypothetical protein